MRLLVWPRASWVGGRESGSHKILHDLHALSKHMLEVGEGASKVKINLIGVAFGVRAQIGAEECQVRLEFRA